MTTGKTIALTRQIFVGKVICLLLNMLSRLVITFLPRSKRLLISWLQSPSAVILEPPKIKSATVSTVSPSICHEVMGPDAMILVFWMLSFKPTFSLSSFTFIKRLFRSSSLSAIRVLSSAYLRLVTSLSPCQSSWPLQPCFPGHVDTEIPEGQKLLHKSHHLSTGAMLEEATHCLRPCSLHWDLGRSGPLALLSSWPLPWPLQHIFHF